MGAAGAFPAYKPPAGAWIVRACPAEPEEVELQLAAISDSSLFSLSVAVSSAERNVLRATPQYRGHPVAGARVDAIFRSPDGNSGRVDLRDDGDLARHGDRRAGDGVYSARLAATGGPGDYVFDVRAVNRGGTYASSDVALAPDFTRSNRAHAFLGGGAGVPGDCDLDGDVDSGDRDAFTTCHTGPGVTVPPVCLCSDFDADLDVDCTDWEAFLVAWDASGAPLGFPPCHAGRVPKTSLQLSKTDPLGTTIELSWDASCSTFVSD